MYYYIIGLFYYQINPEKLKFFRELIKLTNKLILKECSASHKTIKPCTVKCFECDDFC